MPPPLPSRVAEIADQGDAHLVFCERPATDEYRFTIADVSADLEAEFRTLASEVATSLREHAAPVAYAATERPPESQYAVLQQAAAPALWALMRETLVVELQHALNYAVLPDVNLETTRPLFYAIAMHHNHDVVLLGRAIQPRNVPKKSMRINAVFRQGVLHRVEEELVLLDSKVDWIYWDSAFFIVNVPNFERIFIDRQRMLGQVQPNIQAIAARLSIVGQADLEARCAGNLNMADKLQRIIDRGAYQNWTLAQLQAYTARYRPSIQGQGNAVVFDPSPAHQWDILKLLDEAWFTAELSHEPFEATSKIEAH